MVSTPVAAIRRRTKTSAPTNWPILRELPAVLGNIHRGHAYMTEVLIEYGGTYELKGPIFTNMDMFFTCDPADIHYIFSKNFSNYPKGPEFRKIFDILGNGIFNVDHELWELHRKTTMSIMSHENFQILLERSLWDIIEKGLRPILDAFAKQGKTLDLQDVLQRFTFDSITRLLLDHDPRSLSIDLPYLPYEKAFGDALDALLHRHITPKCLWKLQQWLRIGKEKKLMQACEALDQFIYPCIARKQEELMHKTTIKDEEFAFLNAYIKMYNQWNDGDLGTLQTFLRDTFINLMFAGRDTTSAALTWFFVLLAKNPLVEKKIREERFNNNCMLFPSVSLEHKVPLDHDILPSGHCVSPKTRMILPFYVMGRMETLWGKDCLEFKPERWISERGGIKHEPSFKFPAFNAGPRTCLGKEMAFVQMKIVAAAIIHNYNIQVVEPENVYPTTSIVMQVKNGLMVKVVKKV
ncbi:hypothetical protein KY285_006576 [Solanum tuberosum]|nr:hypothetical protein KY289_006568 [Solanum tuberosum]KAH0753428.1 hypothetical protein KY285_006576 [Solanum tuberosum]